MEVHQKVTYPRFNRNINNNQIIISAQLEICITLKKMESIQFLISKPISITYSVN